MGQNYTGNVYKKSYDGDYVKSYEDKNATKKELGRRVKSYKEITQKEGSYNKREKGIFDAGNTERTIDVFDKPVKKVPDRKRTYQETKSVQQPQKKVVQQTPPPKPTITLKQEQPKDTNVGQNIKPEEKKVNAKASAIRDYEAYRTMVMVPVREEARGVYREMKNQELIDEKEARKILDYAGYKQKKSMDFIKFGIIAFIAAVVLTLAGAIAALAWAYFYRQRSHVVLEKKIGFSNLSIRMPANKVERDDIVATGSIYMGIAAVMFVVAIIRMKAL